MYMLHLQGISIYLSYCKYVKSKHRKSSVAECETLFGSVVVLEVAGHFG